MTGITHTEMILRIAMGALLGAAIGYERDRHRRQAGLRTHLIVGLASATFMVVSAHFFFFQNYAGTAGVAVDPSRIAASVVAGIGFLAGGAILKTGLTVQGLTTAAGLWLVAAIGLCAGGGMYGLAMAATLLGLLAMTVLRRLEAKPLRPGRREASIELEDTVQAVPALLAALREAGVSVNDFSYERLPGEGRIRLAFAAELPECMATERFIECLEGYPGVLSVCVKVPG